MIFEAIFDVLFGIPNFLFSLFPDCDYQNLNQLGKMFTDFISTGLYFCGAAPFALIIGNVIFWAGGSFAFKLIEWIYEKIPFKMT